MTNDPKVKPVREATWRDHQQLNFWLWGCLRDGEAYLRLSGEFWGLLRNAARADFNQTRDFNQRRLALQDEVELAKYHFVTSLGSLLRTLDRARSLFPAIEPVCCEAQHIFAEGKAIRDMVEHAAEYEEGSGRYHAAPSSGRELTTGSNVPNYFEIAVNYHGMRRPLALNGGVL
jgi:hypothetical protein